MDSITIYRTVADVETEVETIHPDDNSVQLKQMMGENAISLGFTLNHPAGFKYGDYCSVFGELYKLNSIPLEKKNGENQFPYNLKMEAEYFDLSKAQFLFLGDDNSLKESDFEVRHNARGFIDLLILNANRVSSGWTRGDVQATDYKNLSFSNDSCLTALQRLAEEFSQEWWVEGKTIHLSKRRVISNHRFRHGRNKGLSGITRQPLQGAVFATRLYATGSAKNLPAGYRNFTTRLKMTGGVDHVEANTDQGIVEYAKVFEDIYPHRTGKVTAIVGGDIYKFFDTSIDFDLNQYFLPGVEPKLTFNTGQLAGYTFKIKSFNGNSKEIVILPNTEEKTLKIPSDQLRPAVGDQYVFFDISMPQSYITKAERDLTKAANKLIRKISQPQYSYTIEFDSSYMKRRNRVVGVGMEVIIEDEDLEIDQQIAIVSCTRNIRNENKYSVEISDQKTLGTLASIQAAQTTNSRDISSIRNAYDASKDNNFAGDVKIDKGSIVFSELPVITGDLTQYAKIYINRQTGKIHREA